MIERGTVMLDKPITAEKYIELRKKESFGLEYKHSMSRLIGRILITRKGSMCVLSVVLRKVI